MNPSLLPDPVETLATLALSGSPRTLIALAGFPGSGKSTSANNWTAAVNARLGEPAMVALGMDGFHLPKSVLRAMPDPDEALARRGAPWTFDPAGLDAKLRMLRAGGEVRWPDFQHGVGDPVDDAITVPASARVILVEGLYLLLASAGWEPVRAAFDQRWFLDTPLEISLDRLARRHMASWHLPRAEAERRIARNDRLNAGIVLTTRAAATHLVAAG